MVPPPILCIHFRCLIPLWDIKNCSCRSPRFIRRKTNTHSATVTAILLSYSNELKINQKQLNHFCPWILSPFSPKASGNIQHNNAYCLLCQISPHVYIDLVFFMQFKQCVTVSFDKISLMYNMCGLDTELLPILLDQLLAHSSRTREISHRNTQCSLLHICIRVYKAKLVHWKWVYLHATNLILLLKFSNFLKLILQA